MRDIGEALEGLPPEAALLPGPRLQRQVLLRAGGPAGPPLVYAASWWSAAEAATYLSDQSAPIWSSLARGRVQVHRDLRTVFRGASPELGAAFGGAPGAGGAAASGPFWGRRYVFWHNGRPLTVIHEVFSPSLAALLGPAGGAAGECAAGWDG